MEIRISFSNVVGKRLALGYTHSKILASVVGTGSCESGKETYNSKTATHSYTFEFPVPGGCDATIAVMKNELPTRIDWRASFYSSGWMEVKVAVCTKILLILSYSVESWSHACPGIIPPPPPSKYKAHLSANKNFIPEISYKSHKTTCLSIGTG